MALNPADLETYKSLEQSQKLSYIIEIAMKAHQKIIEDAEFILSHCELSHGLRTLSIRNEWETEYVYSAGIGPDDFFYADIRSSINNVLKVSTQLTHLTIFQFPLCLDWLRTISYLPALHSIDIRFSPIAEASIEDTILKGQLPVCNQVKNLTLLQSCNESRGQSREANGLGNWCTLLLFPSLLTLNHEKVDNPAWFPHFIIRQKTPSLFRNLRRLYLGGPVHHHFLPHLTTWIVGEPGHACSLTHLKLRAELGMPDDFLIPFLESISSAPLQVLSIEGIADGSLLLFDRIAQFFPDLIGLTLVKRDNFSENDTTKMCYWPHSSGEYAERFRTFNKLKHFAWNFAIPFYVKTTNVLVLYERMALEGWEEFSPSNDRELWNYLTSEDDPDAEYFSDEQAIAFPFAAHCSALEFVSIMIRETQEFVCKISRNQRGGIVVKGDWQPKDWFTYIWNPMDWDPKSWAVSMFTGAVGWSPVIT
jgi:hypothetical protein